MNTPTHGASAASAPMSAEVSADQKTPSRAYRCQCGRPVFFRNSQCLACGTRLGYEPLRGQLLPLAPGPFTDSWLPWGETEARPLVRCANFVTASGCNWMVPLDDAAQAEWRQWDDEFKKVAASTPAPAPGPNGQGAPGSLAQMPHGGNDNASQIRPQPFAATAGPASMPPLAPPPMLPPGALAPSEIAAQAQPLQDAPTRFEQPEQAGSPVPVSAEGVPLRPRAPLCLACALNRTIPDLSLVENQGLWRKVELAKRRLVSQLLLLGLPVKSRVREDTAHGLAFDLLHATEGGPRVMTGHANGIITINIEEADDAVRERVRAAMREPYRTLLGHFRHEVGHYYWDRLVLHSHWLDDFRGLFGDERQDYAASLQKNYSEGPPPDWPLHFVSSYASTHPWEDWAESWAHYLHMMDTVGTAESFGVNAQDVDLDHEPFGVQALWKPDAPDAGAFLEFVNGWVRLTAVFNELSRSMGQHDFYPFVLPISAVAKLQFIHLVVTEAAKGWLDLPPTTNTGVSDAPPIEVGSADTTNPPMDAPTNPPMDSPPPPAQPPALPATPTTNA